MNIKKARNIENVKEDIRVKILEISCDLMIQKGIRETTLKDIAESVGISKGTLYYYYAAKEDIIYDIADSHLNRITEELLKWIDEIDHNFSVDQILITVFDKILSADTRGKLNLYLIGNAITNNPELKKKYVEKYIQWQQTIQTGLDKIYAFRTDVSTYPSSKCMSYVILATLDGLIIQKLVGAPQIETKEVVQMLYKSEPSK